MFNSIKQSIAVRRDIRRLEKENKLLTKKIALLDLGEKYNDMKNAISKYPLVLEELEKLKNMNINERLRFLANKVCHEMETLKGESLLIRENKDDPNSISIKQVGVDSRECLCDGDTVAKIKISYYREDLVPK